MYYRIYSCPPINNTCWVYGVWCQWALKVDLEKKQMYVLSIGQILSISGGCINFLDIDNQLYIVPRWLGRVSSCLPKSTTWVKSSPSSHAVRVREGSVALRSLQ